MSTSPNSAAHEYAVLMDHLTKASDKYSKPETVTFSYGTAGFRTTASKLHSVLFRTALLAVLRSKRLEGATIGVMVTASHNPAADNGVKIVDPSGEMLDSTWESHATALSNCPNTSSLISTFTTLATHMRVDLSAPASIVYARDTRPSGPELVAALEAGFSVFPNVKLNNLEVTTTPVLHHVVKATNDRTGRTGKATIEGYFDKLAGAFTTLIGHRGPLAPLYVDCANGVGITAVEQISKRISGILQLKPLNTDIANPTALNLQCGADYVKTKQALPPSIASSGVLSKPGTRACSFDGDADRVVYYFLEDGKNFRLLDGDKIAVMVAVFLGDLIARTKLEGDDKPCVGVVQTAYANGNSTKYLKSRNIPISCVPTGVKYLHHAAQRFDIGVYFEANGHGTVLFSDSCLETLQAAQPNSPDAANAIKHLIAFSQLINQAVGDALSDMLLVEVILAHKGWGAPEWNAGYEDLPNRLLKVEVPDRTIFVAEDAERKLASPEGVQQMVEDAMKKVEMGRAFVRPSGTEDCVRVYAEAKTTPEADGLANTVADIVRHVSGQT